MRIYMDNAATTRMSEPVLKAMTPYFRDIYGNPSSEHGFGRQARQALDAARAQTAKALGAEPEGVYFTSGGTEADNWALRCAGGGHIVTTAMEHHAVLHTCAALEAQGREVTYILPDADGLISPEKLAAAIRPDTALVSVMLVNNEVGAIQPVAALSEIAHAHGALFHTDAVQAVGHMPVDMAALGVDLLSLSAHKFHGPRGVGALVTRRGLKLGRLMEGGAQERGLRPGTENLPGIVGLAAALTTEGLEERADRVRRLRDHMIRRILSEIPGAVLNGHAERRVCGNVNVSFPGADARMLLMRLDLMGIAASAGSACTSGATEPSHVLTAMGLAPDIARSALRLSLSDENTPEEVDAVVEALKGMV